MVTFASIDLPKGTSMIGVVEFLKFQDTGSGFTIFTVSTEAHDGEQTVKGHAAGLRVGELVECVGEWKMDRRWGPQFVASKVIVKAPHTLEGVRRYLHSGIIPGIGKGLADRLVEHFGGDFFEVVDQAPERLHEVSGIGPKRAGEIVEACLKDRASREAVIFLQDLGLSYPKALKVFEAYGDDTISRVRTRPYDLLRDFEGIGFKVADKMALAAGMPKESPTRLKEGLSYVVRERMDRSGHCAISHGDVLYWGARTLEVASGLLDIGLDAMVKENRLTRFQRRDEWYYSNQSILQAEWDVARDLRARAVGAPPWSLVDIEMRIRGAEAALGNTYYPEQRAALHLILDSRVSILTGGPGTGKSTIMGGLLHVLSEAGVRVALAAPTGRAAKRLSETTGRDAGTIHRVFEFDPSQWAFRRNKENPLECDLLVVDEDTMTDLFLTRDLLAGLRPGTAVLFAGDVDQLPSVGPGACFRDMIRSGEIRVAYLNEVHRQAAGSYIIQAARAIKAGLMPVSPPRGESGDFYFVKSLSDEHTQRLITEYVTERLPERYGLDPFRDLQVLSPRRQKHALGTDALNQILQRKLNGQTQGDPVVAFGRRYAAGDKVMQTVNDKQREVYNGDIGRIIAVEARHQVLWVEFDGRELEYAISDLDALELAYATTVHKAQGGEYRGVVIPVSPGFGFMLQWRLYYTAVTRGKELVILVGDPAAMDTVVSRKYDEERVTQLEDFLRGSLRPQDLGLAVA